MADIVAEENIKTAPVMGYDPVIESDPTVEEFFDKQKPMQQPPLNLTPKDLMRHEFRTEHKRIMETYLLNQLTSTPEQIQQAKDSIVWMVRDGPAESARVNEPAYQRENKWWTELDRAVNLLSQPGENGYRFLEERHINKIRASEAMNVVQLRPEVERKLTLIYGELPKDNMPRIPDFAKEATDQELRESALRFIEQASGRKIIRSDYESMLPEEQLFS